MLRIAKKELPLNRRSPRPRRFSGTIPLCALRELCVEDWQERTGLEQKIAKTAKILRAKISFALCALRTSELPSALKTPWNVWLRFLRAEPLGLRLVGSYRLAVARCMAMIAITTRSSMSVKDCTRPNRRLLSLNEKRKSGFIITALRHSVLRPCVKNPSAASPGCYGGHSLGFGLGHWSSPTFLSNSLKRGSFCKSSHAGSVRRPPQSAIIRYSDLSASVFSSQSNAFP